MKKKKTKILIIILVLIEIISINMTYKSYNNRIDEQKTNNVIDNMISIQVEDTKNDSGEIEWVNYNKNSWPSSKEGYSLNFDMSFCQDNLMQNVNIKNVLSYDKDNDKVQVNATKSFKCYLYFNKCNAGENTVLEGKNGLSACPVGGMYRYQGTDDVNNYICFGTTDKSKCTSGTGEYGDGIDKYMYRIIGVTSDGQLALIKEVGVRWDMSTPSFAWDSSLGSDRLWGASAIYKHLNGLYDDSSTEDVLNSPNKYINNYQYDYLQNGSAWLERINDHIWKYGETKDFGNYNGNTIYAIENAFTNSVKAKIGLQYLHDYYYAYPGGNPGNQDNAKTAWIYFKKNRNNASSVVGDFFISMYGYNTDDHALEALVVNFQGKVISASLNIYGNLARPVFYLKPDTVLKSGSTGSKNDPFIIDITPKDPEIVTKLREKDSQKQLSTNIVSGMYRYQGTDGVNNYICFGTSNKSTCIGSTDKYMYRIIGVTSNNHLKIMKETDLGVIYWFDTENKSIASNKYYGSDLYNKLNGSAFLNNNTYLPSEWRNKIFSYNYYNGYSNNFGSITPDEVYKIETGQEEAIGVVTAPGGGPTSGKIGSWQSNSFKIALPYVHDYLYSIANNTNNCFSSGSCKSWMVSTNSYKTMSTCGQGGNGAPCGVYYITKNSNIATNGYTPEKSYSQDALNVRPSFYLNSNITITGGTGTSSDPFLIN